MKKINLLIKNILLKFIDVYQRGISPFFKKYGVKCKYFPTCSEYTKQAIIKYGCVRGVLKGFLRICKCNPFSKGGYDPLE